MSVTGNVLSLVSRRSETTSPANPAAWLLGMWGGWRTASGKSVTPELAKTVSAFYRCVAILAETTAGLPLVTYKRRKDGGKERADALDVYSILHDSPNPEQTPFEFREMMVGHLAMRGNFYARKEIDNAGRLRALWPLHPDRVRPYRNTKRNILYEYRPASGPVETLLRDEVHHVRTSSADGLKGDSQLSYMSEVLGMSLAAEEFGARFFSNDATPSGVLYKDGKLSDPAYNRLKADIANRQGSQESHRTMILEEGLKWQQIGINARDAQLLELRRFSVADIARFFGIPLHMLQETDRTTCVPADAVVSTPDGPRRADEIRAGMRVWSLNDHGEFVHGRVTHAGQTGYDQILTFRTTSRSLRVNGKHRVLVRRKFAAPRRGQGGYRAVGWRNVWVKAEEITSADLLFVPKRLSGAGGRAAPNGRVLTVGFMEFCGLYVGDGTMRRDANGEETSISIARHAGAPYMDYYRRVMLEEFTASSMGGCFTFKDRRVIPIHLQEYERSTCFSSKRAAQEFVALGFSGTAHTKRIPSWLFEIDADLQCAFLRGYVDSDGAAHRRGWITFSSANPDLLSDVQQLCWAAGLSTGRVNRYEMAGQCVVNGRTVTRGDMYQLCLYRAQDIQQIGSHHPKKQAAISAAKPSRRINHYDAGFKGRGPKGSRPGEGFTVDSCALQRICSIEKSAVAQPVYDLCVEDSHTFVSDGVVVHNSWGSGIESMSIGFVVYTLMPWLQRIEQASERDLLTPTERKRHYVKFVVKGLLRGDAAARGEFYNKMFQIGSMSQNDIRELEDENPIKGGDKYFVPLNMRPHDEPIEPKQSTEPEPEPVTA